MRLSALLAHMAQAEVVTPALTAGDVNIGGLFEATGAVEPASRGEVLRRSVRLVDVEPSDSIVPPSAFDVMRERLLNATVR